MQTDGDMGWWRVEGSIQTRKEHNLNQQQDFDLGHKLKKANSETEICKGYGAEGSRTGKMSMALDYGTNPKHSKLGNKSEPDGIPELYLPFNGNMILIFHQV